MSKRTTETDLKLAIPARWFSRNWVCQVVRSGFHNGARCTPSEAHDGWGCGYRYEISFPESDWPLVTGQTEEASDGA